MLRIYVDFNAREVHGGFQSVLVRTDTERSRSYVDRLSVGGRVIIHDDYEECEGILRRDHDGYWFADVPDRVQLRPVQN